MSDKAGDARDPPPPGRANTREPLKARLSRCRHTARDDAPTWSTDSPERKIGVFTSTPSPRKTRNEPIRPLPRIHFETRPPPAGRGRASNEEDFG